MTLPHTAYADAIHTALLAAGLTPQETAVSATESRSTRTDYIVQDMAIVVTWESGHRLMWRHSWGWYLDRPDRRGAFDDLGLPVLVAPQHLIAPVRAALAGTPGVDSPEQADLWEHHQALDVALSRWEDQP